MASRPSVRSTSFGSRLRAWRLTPQIGVGLVSLLAPIVLFSLLTRESSGPEAMATASEGAKPEWARTGKRPGLVPNDWFHLQRAFPGTEIAPDARREAVEAARAMTAAAAAAGAAAADGGGPRGGGGWELAGPTNIGGRITAIAPLPGGATIFVGAAAGGVFRSTDSGANWTPVFDEVGPYSIGAMTHGADGAIWVGTGEANASGDSFAGDGLYRSTDGGDTWEFRGLPASRHIGRVAAHPSDPSRLYVAAMGALFSKNPERGVYRTTNAGSSWDRVLFVNDSTGAVDVVVDPTNPQRVYAATWERIRRPSNRRVGGFGSGIHRSTDGGTTWQLLAGGLPAPAANRGRIGLAIAASNPQVLYAIYADDPGNFAGLYKSTNGGDTWTRTSDGTLSGMYSGFGWYFGNVRVSPTDANRVFAVGLDDYRSTNGGSSWSFITSGVHVDHHDLWIDPSNTQRLLAACDGGLYRSTNGGSSWSFISGLPIAQFYAGTIDPSQPERLYGGLQDNSTTRTLTGAIDDWDIIYFGDGFYTLVDPRDSNVIFAEYQYGGLGKSNDGGFGWSDATSGISGSDRRNWSTPVVFDPVNPDRMYYGTYRLYRTTNGASSWSVVSSDLTGGPGGGSLPYGTITTIVVAPSNTQRLYVGTDDARVWTSTNGGGAWINVSAGLPNRWVTRVMVDPVDPAVAYVTLSGYRQDIATAHVYRTTNAGATWTAIDGNLPDAPVNAIIVDPDLPSTLYVGSDVGVFVTRDLGASWDVLDPALPPTAIFDLTLHAPTRSLVAATHGRSMYRIELPATTGVGDDGAGGAGGGAGPAGGLNAARPSLAAPFPNPVSLQAAGVVRFSGSVARGAAAEISVLDVSGRVVRRLAATRDDAASGLAASDLAESGRDRVEAAFDLRDDGGRAIPHGVYFARLSSGGGAVTQRVVVSP